MLHRFLFFALIAWFNAPLALAQGEDDARERFILGQKAYQEGDYDRAIAEWKAAYELDARSRILYNLSQAYERAGRLAEAVESLDEFLARIDDGDPVRETAIARLAAMRERLRRTGLQILDAPAGAEIFVNGESW
jgi:tetratricopeptide (TPR) repeat protein